MATSFAQTPPADETKEDVPAFNDWGARTFLIEVEPLVKKYTGWTLADFPKFKLMTREQYCEATVREILPLLSKPKASAAATVSETLAREIRPHAVGLLGRYSPLSRTIYLLPGNLKPVMRHLHVSDHFTRDLVEIICAHEMTHAFQDGKYPRRERWPARGGRDAQEAYAMLTEGHAMFVQDRVARELKVEEAARTMAEEMASREAIATKTLGEDRTVQMRRYTAGLKFVEAVYARGGLAKVQALFEHPPRSPALIVDPELFFAAEQAAETKPAAR